MLAGLVPERASKVAKDGHEAGKQTLRQVLARRVFGDGHVPWPNGLDSVAAAAQPAVQRHGRTTQSQLDGLPLAFILRSGSVLDFNCSAYAHSIRSL